MRKSLHWILGFAISGLALWLAFRGVHLEELWQALATARYIYVLPGFAMVFIGQLARARSWQTILGNNLPYRRVFGALNVGALLNNVLPFRLGELGRAYLVSRTGEVKTPQALSSVVVERVIDLVMVLTILLALFPVVSFQAWTWEAGLVAGLIGGVALSFMYGAMAWRPQTLRLVQWLFGGLERMWPALVRLESWVNSVLDGLAALQTPGRLLRAALWSLSAWLFAGVGVYCILLAFIPTARLEMGYFVLVVTALGIAVPSAPGSVGVWQAAVVGALSVFNVPSGIALSISLMHHLANYSVTCSLGALALAQEGENLTHLIQAARRLAPEKPT